MLNASSLHPRKSGAVTPERSFPPSSSPSFPSNTFPSSLSSSTTFGSKLFTLIKRFFFNKVIMGLIGIITLIFLLKSFMPSSTPKHEQHPIFMEFAKLLTNSDGQSRNGGVVIEGSYAWYREQLEKNNRLGKTLFNDPVMTRFGFQDTLTTSKDFFYYFRTFETKKQCKRQHSCEIYADKTAGEFLEKGVRLDAVLHHCFYRGPFYLNTPEDEARIVNDFQSQIVHSKSITGEDEKNDDILDYSNKMDEIYGEKLWRGMRRLSILMCSEALIGGELEKMIQNEHALIPYFSMERFALSTADISICFLSTCSVWVNYHYNPIALSNSKQFGTKSFKKNKGICAFISNCDRGGTELKERFDLLQDLSKYLPVKQYGKCGKNSQEGPGGKSFELENNCRFYFAAENTILKDYVTEKFFDGARAIQNGAKMLILYRGAPNLRQDFGFPKSLYIDIADFKSTADLGRYLKKLNDNDQEFEEQFTKLAQDRTTIDKALAGFEPKLGANIPCRICKVIGEMKLARYLLFKIGFKPTNRPKVNLREWNNFKVQRFSSFSPERLKILDEIYFYAFKIFQNENNKLNEFNLGWDFDSN